MSKQSTSERWFEEACIAEMDYFINTLSSIKEKQLRPDLIGLTIMHYASKWLPELAEDEPKIVISTPNKESPTSITVCWLKKKLFIESITGILPPEKESIPCNFLLRLLRIGNMVAVEPTYLDELEKRVSWQLDEASLKELMIPSFSHTCNTLLDIDLVIRLVKKFMIVEDVVHKNGGAFVKVAKLIDCYLAEAAVDSELRLSQFWELASLIPSHARATNDGLYRAIDTYLKAHPSLSKQERKSLWDLIDLRKLSQEASFHASQNERLPVRALIQVLLSEQFKLNKQVVDWSGSLQPHLTSPVGTGQIEHATSRCLSKREMNIQHNNIEIKRLKEDVLKLQSQCMVMERQIDKLSEKKRSSGYFGLKKIVMIHHVFKGNVKINGLDQGDVVIDSFGTKTPARLNRRRSMS